MGEKIRLRKVTAIELEAPELAHGYELFSLDSIFFIDLPLMLVGIGLLKTSFCSDREIWNCAKKHPEVILGLFDACGALGGSTVLDICIELSAPNPPTHKPIGRWREKISEAKLAVREYCGDMTNYDLVPADLIGPLMDAETLLNPLPRPIHANNRNYYRREEVNQWLWNI